MRLANPELIERNRNRDALTVRAWRNLFGIGLMVPGREELAEEAWLVLRPSPGKQFSEDESGFAKFLRLCGTVRFGSPWLSSDDREAAKDLLKDDLERMTTPHADVPEFVILPYDRSRFSAWIRACLPASA